MTSSVVACLAAALGAALWWAPSPRVPRAAEVRLPGWALPLAVAPALLLGPAALVVAALAGLSVWVLLRLLSRRRIHREAVEAGRRVLESCELIAGELAAGSPSGVALRRAADAWSPLAPAARAAELGGDVPAALREAAAAPGARELRLVAGAWTVAHRTGHGLADALATVADSVRSAASTRRVVAGELASARATARLVAALPVVAWLMGAGSGARPWEFLVNGPLGLACLAGGVSAMGLGLWWIEVLAGDDS